jgi:hypothetical protein
MGGRDDRLSLGSFDGVESGKRVIEVRDVSDVRAKTPLPDPPDNFPQLFTIGLDNQIDGQASFGFGARARPMPMTYAPASCASYGTGEPTPPAASWKRTL